MGLGLTVDTVGTTDTTPPPPPPPVSLITVDGFPTLDNVVQGAQEITFTLSGPPGFAGSYVIDASEQVATATGPVNDTVPTLSGASGPGEVLSCDGGLWAFDPDHGVPEYSFQWRRAGTDIPGATEQDYAQDVADAGEEITCQVSATQSVGARSVLSAPMTLDPASGQAPPPLLERVGTDFYADNDVSTDASITVDLSTYGAGDTVLIFTGPGEYVEPGKLSVDGAAATKISSDVGGLFGARQSAFSFELQAPGNAAAVIATIDGNVTNSRIFAVYVVRGFTISQVVSDTRGSGSAPLSTELTVTSPVNAVLSCAVGLTWSQATWSGVSEDETEVLTGDSISTAQVRDVAPGNVTPSVALDTDGRTALISVLLEGS